MKSDRPSGMLLTWTTWLRLRHPMLFRINWVASPVAGCAIALSLWLSGSGLNVVADKGVIVQVNGLLQILAPFFVGALAAISSLQRQDFDNTMGGQQPTLWEHGEKVLPTRREFFGYLFGYLAALSILVYGFGAIVQIGASSTGSVAACVTYLHATPLVHFVRAAYATALINLGLTTFVGLHFLISYLPTKPFVPGARHLNAPSEQARNFIPDDTSGDDGGSVGHTTQFAAPRQLAAVQL